MIFKMANPKNDLRKFSHIMRCFGDLAIDIVVVTLVLALIA